ncbi:MAG: hypothetical protein ACJ71M_00825 [Nitrososphaeraceae archaeon]
MEHLTSGMEQQQNQVQWRRDKVQELCSKGYSQREISQVLQVGLAKVNGDISYLRNQAKDNIKKYIDERLPEEYEKCLVGLSAILKRNMDCRFRCDGTPVLSNFFPCLLCFLKTIKYIYDAMKFFHALRYSGL